jgi:hypothetical protein
MAHTTVDHVELSTFLSQIKPVLLTPSVADGPGTNHRPQESDRWDEMITTLVNLHNLPEDWDGLGAKAPVAALLETAVELAQVLRQYGFRSPSRVGAGPDGEILLEWQDQHIYLEAEICKPDSAEWMLALDGQTPRHWVTGVTAAPVG